MRQWHTWVPALLIETTWGGGEGEVGGCLSDPIVLPLSTSLSHTVYTLGFWGYLLLCSFITENGDKYFPPSPFTLSIIYSKTNLFYLWLINIWLKKMKVAGVLLLFKKYYFLLSLNNCKFLNIYHFTPNCLRNIVNLRFWVFMLCSQNCKDRLEGKSPEAY